MLQKMQSNALEMMHGCGRAQSAKLHNSSSTATFAVTLISRLHSWQYPSGWKENVPDSMLNMQNVLLPRKASSGCKKADVL
jgi:hypothetical protein